MLRAHQPLTQEHRTGIAPTPSGSKPVRCVKSASRDRILLTGSYPTGFTPAQKFLSGDAFTLPATQEERVLPAQAGKYPEPGPHRERRREPRHAADRCRLE